MADQFSAEQLAAKYGVAAHFLQEFPDLMALFTKIANSKTVMADADILAAIQNSNFGKTYTKKYIEVEQARAQNPALYDAQVKSYIDSIRKKFVAAGSTVPDDATLQQYAENMMHGGGLASDGSWNIYDDTYLNKVVASAVDFTKTKTVNGYTFYDLTGAAEDVATNLYKIASDYGMDTAMSNKAFTSWFEKTSKAIAEGTMSSQDADDEVVQMAMSRFPGLAQQLQRGSTLRDAADPYLTAIANTLEVDVNSLDFSDDLVQRALNSVDDKGAFKPMSIYDVQKLARRDNRWKYTSAAQQEYTSKASLIARDFGFLG